MEKEQLGKLVCLYSVSFNDIFTPDVSMHQGSILVLRDGTRASEITLTLLLAALVAEDPMLINSLKQLVLLSIALDKDLPSDEWPKDLQALLDRKSVV